jgi:hypothetical protein
VLVDSGGSIEGAGVGRKGRVRAERGARRPR